jgi:hypothetical protein
MALAVGSLHVDSDEDGRVLRHRWRGRATELRPADALDAYFAPVLERASHQGLSLEHHFEKLEYFNSAFISWVIRHLRRTLAAQVRTVIYFEPKSEMHRSSFEALKFLQRDNPGIEVREAPPAP